MRSDDGGSVTFVMYHYVRPRPDEHGFTLDGLTPERFEGQLDYIARHYSVVSLRDVVAAAKHGETLPPRPCVLTFDDGLVDHARYVAPRLRTRGWSGAFFAAADSARRRMLLVHRIHLLLAASRADPDALVRAVIDEIADHVGPEVPSLEELRAAWWHPNRFDPAPINFVKRTLQRGLPARVAREITARLFAERISADEEDFAATFYLDESGLRELVEQGMEVGGHGVDHSWLDALDEAEQEERIRGSVELVRRVHGGTLPDPWTFAYPYGAYDATSLQLLERFGCGAALTVRPALAGPDTPLLEIPRLDTNDLPFSAAAPASAWTRAAAGGSPS